MQQAVAAGVFPGAVLAVRRGDSPAALCCAGRLSHDPSSAAVTPETVYDLASLTKPLATVTAIMLLIQEGRCGLDDRIERFLPECQEAPIAGATLRHLLSHSAGLPGWRGFYETVCPAAALPASSAEREEAERRMLRLLAEEPLVYARGTRSLYSDLGFMLLGFMAERVAGLSLDRLVKDRIVPLAHAEGLGYRPGGPANDEAANGTDAIAPTEYDPWRNRLLRGEVHDENAAALGGVAGHAGLFGTAPAVLAVTHAWTMAWRGRESWLRTDLVRDVTRRQGVPDSSWALGWDTPSASSSSGRHFSPMAFGHLGYTGTSVWIDPDRELEVVLLSNRVHPTRRNEAIRQFRPVIHDVVYETWVGRGQAWSG